jgi:hypothetical protein
MTGTINTRGSIRLSTVLSVALLLGPARLMAAETAPRSQPARAATRTAQGPEDPGTRIQRLHNQLQITPEQEALWTPIAAAMQDNAKSIAAAMQARSDKTATMNALDDIMTYEAVAAIHAAGLKRLADTFGPLYAAMSPAQQRNADMVFGHRLKSGQQG